MNSSDLSYLESGTYGRVRYSGTQIDIYYGNKYDYQGRGHVVIVGNEAVYVRSANSIPSTILEFQQVNSSGLNPRISGGSLWI